MPITITSAEINPILHCNRPLSPNTQCRIGLISAEVIVIGIVNPMPLFPSLFSQSYLLIFSQKVFALVINGHAHIMQKEKGEEEEEQVTCYSCYWYCVW